MDVAASSRLNEQIRREQRTQDAWKSKYGRKQDFLYPDDVAKAERLRALNVQAVKIARASFSSVEERIGGLQELRALMAQAAAAEAVLPPLLRTLAGDPLRAILKHIGGVDLTCARLACRDFRDHSSPAQEAMRRSDFLRTRALAVFAFERLPGFVLNLLRMLRLVASFGFMGALKELVDHRQCELTVDAICADAEREGHLEVLRYAHEHGCPWDSSTYYLAAKEGHLEVLRYAHERGCPWDRNTCYQAAYGGHLEVLRYAHEHGCPWDSDTCEAAAGGGHVEVLRYAHEHGCPQMHALRTLAGVACADAQTGHAPTPRPLLPFASRRASCWREWTCR
ncbi:hypothetical protein T492DRAFT_899215 [Pavlovales sp. CCMP2436]|nr:hypothetical protein T492DRAFT_899215 [Pavlovales sp. CCMP2436]